MNAKLDAAGLTDEQLIEKFSFTIEAMPRSRVNDVLEWLGGEMGNGGE